MNKVLLVGRLVRNPETASTQSGIKYTRFTIAITRPFGEDQADFVPVVAWRQSADFVDKYAVKGSRVSIEGRFSSSTYKNANDETVTRYEVAADRVQMLDTKSETEQRISNTQEFNLPKTTSTKEEIAQTQDVPTDVPWELDL